jgi:ubiquinone biosynthesis protein COQ9
MIRKCLKGTIEMKHVKVIQVGYETVEVERTLFLLVPNDWSEDQILEALEECDFEEEGWTVSAPEEIHTPENIDRSEVYDEDQDDLPDDITCYWIGDEEGAVHDG